MLFYENLNDKFKKLGIGKYQKNMNNIFEILMEFGNPELAIRYAKRIMKDGAGKTPTEMAPGTKVYELVEELAKYLPEEEKSKFIVDKNRQATPATRQSVQDSLRNGQS